MKFPQFLNPSVGLAIHGDCVRAVVLKKLFGHVFLIGADEASLSRNGDSVQEKIDAIQKVTARLPAQTRDVSVYCDNKSIRFLLTRIPNPQAHSSEAAIRRFLLDHLPSGIDISDIQYGAHVLNRTDDSVQLLIHYSMPGATDELEALIREAGLTPVYLAAGRFDLLNTVVLNHPEILNQKGCVLDAEGDLMSVFSLEQGVLVDYQKFVQADPVEAVSRYLSQSKFKSDGRIKCMYTPNRDSRRLQDHLNSPDLEIQPIDPFRWVVRFGKKQTDSPGAGYALATGLALQSCYPNLYGLNLFPRDKQAQIRENRYKQKTMQVILGFGSVILIGLFVLQTLLWHLEVKQAGSEEALFLMRDRIQAVRRVKQSRETLKSQIHVMQQLLKEGSRVSEILEEISRIVPASVWLDEIHWGDSKGSGRSRRGENQVLISGWSLTENAITDLVSNMESSPFFNQVRLEEIRRFDRERVHKMHPSVNRALNHFRVSLDLKNTYVVN